MKTQLSNKHLRMHQLINIKGDAQKLNKDFSLPRSAKAKFWYKPTAYKS